MLSWDGKRTMAVDEMKANYKSVMKTTVSSIKGATSSLSGATPDDQKLDPLVNREQENVERGRRKRVGDSQIAPSMVSCT